MLFDCRDAFAQAIEELAEINPKVVAVANDSIGSSKLVGFAHRFPDRIINVGIAEQTLVGVGAGLANAGKVPFVCSAACFLTARALEQIKVDVAYSSSNVKLCGMSSGLAYGPLGATHHSIEDVAWLRAIPGITIVVPSDPIETAQAVHWAASTDGPVYLRISRTPVPAVHTAGYRFEVGRAECLRGGKDITIIAMGTMVAPALEAAATLATLGVSARVLNMATVSPIDEEAVITAAEETSGVVVVEEHTIHGGLGSAVAEIVATHHPTKLKLLGIPGVFAPTGSAEWLLEHFGLNAGGIVSAAMDLLAI